MKKFKDGVGVVCQIGEYISCAIIAFLAVMIGINVITRRLFSAPIFGVTEIVQYGTLAAISLACAQTTWRREHPCVGLLIDSLKPMAQSILNTITDLACVVILGLTVKNLWPGLIDAINSTRKTETLNIPYWIVTGLIYFAILSTSLVILIQFVLDIIAIVKPDTFEATEREISLEGSSLIADAVESAENAE